MANKNQRHEDNAPGRFYVDKDCVVCTTCFEVAPKNFKMSEQGDHYVVWRQPGNPEEEAQCRTAVEQCPMGAVGDDGDT